MTTPIGYEAAIPNPALTSLGFLVGEWRIEGSHPLLPGKEEPTRPRLRVKSGRAFGLRRTESPILIGEARAIHVGFGPLSAASQGAS